MSQLESLAVRALCKRFATRTGMPRRVLDRIDLHVAAGEVVAIVGANGAGKTTLLRIIAGLCAADAGEVTARVGGRDVRIDVPDGGRRSSCPTVAMVFQDYAASLLPWRTCLDNVALPLEIGGIGRLQRLARTRARLAELGLAGRSGEDAFAELGIPADAFPYALSDGQKQWLVVLRALVAEAEVVLLDEPFAAIDIEARWRACERLVSLGERQRRAWIVVTHSIEEAVYLADRVVVLGSRPARVAATLEVPLARPRPPVAEALDEPALRTLCARARAALRGEAA